MSKQIKLPSGEVVRGSELVLPDGHFNWNEVTKNLTMIPKTVEVAPGHTVDCLL